MSTIAPVRPTRSGNTGIVPPWLTGRITPDMVKGADDPHILPVPYPSAPLPEAPTPKEL